MGGERVFELVGEAAGGLPERFGAFGLEGLLTPAFELGGHGAHAGAQHLELGGAAPLRVGRNGAAHADEPRPSHQFVEGPAQLATEVAGHPGGAEGDQRDHQHGADEDEAHGAAGHEVEAPGQLHRLAELRLVPRQCGCLLRRERGGPHDAHRLFSALGDPLPRRPGGEQRQRPGGDAGPEERDRHGGNDGEEQQHGKQARAEWRARSGFPHRQLPHLVHIR